MREKLIYALGVGATLLLVRNLYVMFLQLPDEVLQGGIYRIIFFHVPAAFTFMTAALVSLVTSALFLIKRNFAYDDVAAAVTEVGLVFGIINLTTGMIWARIIWGVWWAWDARLTSMLVSCVLYGSYLMLRQAVEESTMRARFSAVLSIFTFPGVVITYKAIDWWRTQHPGPVLSIRGVSGGMDPAMQSVLYLNFLAVLLFATVMVLIRTQQEQTRRELDALRREAHAF